MKPIPYPLGPYMPDAADASNPGLEVCKNVFPTATSYKSVQALAAYSSALSDVSPGFLGGYGATKSDGNHYLYAGTDTTLEVLADTSWTDVTRSSGGAYATASGDRWEMVQWGDTIIATNYTDEVQTITMGGANFAPLITSTDKPNGKHIAVIRDIVVMANINDGDGVNPLRVRWSAIGDPADWDESNVTQAGKQDMRDGGVIERIIGGEYGILFQRDSVTRINYVGPSAVFQFDRVENTRGTNEGGSVIKLGPVTYYWGIDAFYAYDGSGSRPISTGRISRKVAEEKTSTGSMWVTHHPTEHVVLWSYPSAVTGSTVILAYNYAADKWATIENGTTLDGLLSFKSTGYTLETLDNVSSDIDTLPASLDSDLWRGGTPAFGAFKDGVLQTMSGTAMTAVLETGDLSPFPGKRADVQGIRPLIEGNDSTTTIRVGSRNKQNEDLSYTASSSINASGIAPVRSNGRYTSIELTISGGFDQAIGCEVLAAPAGER